MKAQDTVSTPAVWSGLEQEALAFQPLGTRLRPPVSRIPLVERRALLDDLLADARPLVLLSAPAGYGKTTVLAQWAAADSRPSAWVQLDPADDDPVVFLTYLALALGGVTPLDPAALDLLRRRTPPLEELVLPALAASVSAADPFLLFLDDAHLVGNETCWRFLDELLDALPAGAQLCIATRTSTRLPVARLRAQGHVGEYGVAELAMDDGETAALLALHGVKPAPEEVAAALAASEGWPAGLRLGLLTKDGRPHGTHAPPAARGDGQAVAAFLTEEVLDHLSPDLQRFLLRTSILERLSPSLCRVVAEDDGAGLRLARLASDNLFVVPLDDHGEWYRYHHLFGELLAALQLRRAPAEVPALHGRAAEWYADHDDPERAVRHWLAADDVASAAAPTFLACFELVERGQKETARRMLDAFSDEQLRAHTALVFAAAWLYGTVLGDPGGERWLHLACSLDVGDQAMPEGEGSWRGYQAGLRAFLAPDGARRMLVDAELGLACDLAAGIDPTESRRALGVALYLNGRSRQATGEFEQLLRESDDRLARGYSLGFLSLIAADEGRHDDAARLDAEALSASPDMGLDLSPGMYLALPQLLSHARVLGHQGAPETDAAIARAERYLGDMVPQVPWRVLLIALVLGEVRLARGEDAEAERWAAVAEKVIGRYPDAGMLPRRARRLRTALEERRMAEPLTAAERRVLDLLPTQLTARQVAARLFLTENTVKSHMSHIYRKLGVTARTDAVDRARSLGLL